MCKISSCFCRTENDLDRWVRYAATCAHPPLPTLLHPLCKQDKSRHFRKFLDKGRILVFGELLWLRTKFSEDPLWGKACEPSFYLLWVPLLWIRRSTSRCVRIIMIGRWSPILAWICQICRRLSWKKKFRKFLPPAAIIDHHWFG